MHYKNGREAKNGDKVVLFPSYGAPVVGILYDAVAGNDTCTGRLAHISRYDPRPDLREVLHVDDVQAAVKESELCNAPPAEQAVPADGAAPSTPKS